MFPASATIIQLDSRGGLFIEDRDSAVGYQLPPCYSTQVSYLLSGGVAANGTLMASWTRPQRLPPALLALGYLDLTAVNLTLIGASSSDGDAVAGACEGYMQPHTLVQPGVGPFPF